MSKRCTRCWGLVVRDICSCPPLLNDRMAKMMEERVRKLEKLVERLTATQMFPSRASPRGGER